MLGRSLWTTEQPSCLALQMFTTDKGHKPPLEELLHLHYRCSSAPKGFSWLLFSITSWPWDSLAGPVSMLLSPTGHHAIYRCLPFDLARDPELLLSVGTFQLETVET